MKLIVEDIQKKLKAGVYKNEEHVRLSLVARILMELGWDLWNPNEVNTEFVAAPNEDNSKVDLALFVTPEMPSVYIEVKAAGKMLGDISRFETQMRNYNRDNTAIFTVITDGQKWRFYYSLTQGVFSKKCFMQLDILNDNPDEVEHSFQRILSKTHVVNGSAEQHAKLLLQEALNPPPVPPIPTPATSANQAQTTANTLVRLDPVQNAQDIQDSLATFSRDYRNNLKVAKRFLGNTTYWVYSATTGTFGPSKFVGFKNMTFARYIMANSDPKLREGVDFNGKITREAIERALGKQYRQDASLLQKLSQWAYSDFQYSCTPRRQATWRFIEL